MYEVGRLFDDSSFISSRISNTPCKFYFSRHPSQYLTATYRLCCFMNGRKFVLRCRLRKFIDRFVCYFPVSFLAPRKTRLTKARLQAILDICNSRLGLRPPPFLISVGMHGSCYVRSGEEAGNDLEGCCMMLDPLVGSPD